MPIDVNHNAYSYGFTRVTFYSAYSLTDFQMQQLQLEISAIKSLLWKVAGFNLVYPRNASASDFCLWHLSNIASGNNFS